MSRKILLWVVSLLVISLPAASIAGTAGSIVLKNGAGLSWELVKRPGGWSLGRILYHGKPVEQTATGGIIALRHRGTGETRWIPATSARKTGPRGASFSGSTSVDGTVFSFTMDVALDEKLPAAILTPSWNVERQLTGWSVCLAYHDSFTQDWRVQSYPWAGNSEKVDIAPMRYCGVPGALVYKPDLSLVLLFAIDIHTDYLNPATWTGRTGFHFANRRTPPQFRLCGDTLRPSISYTCPVQLLLSDAGEFSGAITGIMQNWIAVNRYEVDTSLHVRSPHEAFMVAVEGRKRMPIWKPGVGYEHHEGTPFVYLGNNPVIAYYEYRVFEMTGDTVWRTRCFDQINFALKAQQSDASKPFYGVFNTSWYFQRRDSAFGFCSWDWDHNGYKVDINAWMARYILQTWEEVKKHEGIDRQDWYKAALASANWVIGQQNPDGGLPQVVDIQTGQKSKSVVSQRALVGLPVIARITGDSRFMNASHAMEQFLRKNVEGRFWFTGAHPDLYPDDYEQDSMWGVVEYWLNKFEQTNDEECLRHATANAYYGLLYWCPKQLSWVKHPTQCAHSEQQNFSQYSVYSYHNRKIQCLFRLAKLTGNKLFESLGNRVMQLNFFTQVTEGPYRGAMTEAICDPWLERESGFEYVGAPYTSELVVDLMLQLMDLGLESGG